MVFQQQLTERLRPKELKAIILLDRVKNSMGDGVVSDNLLFAGSPGIGKTSLMKLLVNGHDYKYINASEERGIDAVRDVMDYCSTYSSKGVNEIKYVLLDEFDGATPEFYKAFRAASEKFPHVRFLATCNYLNKLSDPILSRFLLLEFDPKNADEEEELYEKYAKRIKLICSSPKLLNNEVQWEDDEVLKLFIKKNYPDMRRIVRKLQDFQTSKIGTVTMENIKILNYTFNDLFELATKINIKDKEELIYKTIMTDYQNKVDEVLASFGSEFQPWLEENAKDKMRFLPSFIIHITEYMYVSRNIIDPALALSALIYKLNTTVYGVK